MTDKETLNANESDNTGSAILNLLQVVVGTILLVAAYCGYSLLGSAAVLIPGVMGAILLFSGRAIFSKQSCGFRTARASNKTMNA